MVEDVGDVGVLEDVVGFEDTQVVVEVLREGVVTLMSPPTPRGLALKTTVTLGVLVVVVVHVKFKLSFAEANDIELNSNKANTVSLKIFMVAFPFFFFWKCGLKLLDELKVGHPAFN